jgi:hypothetical protein
LQTEIKFPIQAHRLNLSYPRLPIMAQKYRKPTNPTPKELEWITDHGGERSSAELCWRYAAMVNTHDISWIVDCIDEDARYSSQVVYRELEGRQNILRHLEKKLLFSKFSDPHPPKAALADFGRTSPCVAVYQAKSDIEISAWDEPTICMSLTSENGLITDFFILAVAPTPSEANVAEIFPLISPPLPLKPQALDKDSYDQLSFKLFSFKGESSLERTAKENVLLTMEHFQGATFEEVDDTMDNQDAYENGLLGFPSLIIRLRGEVLFRSGGVGSSEKLTKRLQEALSG